MIFTDSVYFVFFALVFALYWSVRNNMLRKVILLSSSNIFYAAWDWRFLSLLWISTLVDYFVALQLSRTDAPNRRKLLLLISLTSNLGMLGIFKYFSFFADSFADLLTLFGMHATHTTLHIVLPVGISFFTFQTMSYTIDVYRKKLAVNTSLLDVSLFVAFFPQLVAGPIVRAAHFLPQLTAKRIWKNIPKQRYLLLFLSGFIKKSAIADNIAGVVDPIFASPQLYDAPAMIAGVLLYAVQIYCDFSGYTEMAIASAGLLGFKLPRNFRAPYLAVNITDFWRRWHISLSTWLRDYLYISLGGNRGTTLRRYGNIMTTMLLGGLWHGASWNFVLWGGLHGAYLVFHKLYLSARTTPRSVALKNFVGWAATFYLTCLAWIFFRASTMADAWVLLHSFTSLSSTGDKSVGLWPFGIFLSLGLFHFVWHRLRLELRLYHVNPYAFAMGYAVMWWLALMFIPLSVRPFIYFQF